MQLVGRVWERVWIHDALGRAAQLAYFFLLSLFPFLLFLTALLGAFVESSAALRMRLLEYISAFAPFQTQLLFSKTLDEISASSGGGKVVLGFLTGLWIASFASLGGSTPMLSLRSICSSRPATGTRSRGPAGGCAP